MYRAFQWVHGFNRVRRLVRKTIFHGHFPVLTKKKFEMTNVLGCTDQHFAMHLIFSLDITHWNKPRIPPNLVKKTPKKSYSGYFYMKGTDQLKPDLQFGVRSQKRYRVRIKKSALAVRFKWSFGLGKLFADLNSPSMAKQSLYMSLHPLQAKNKKHPHFGVRIL